MPTDLVPAEPAAHPTQHREGSRQAGAWAGAGWGGVGVISGSGRCPGASDLLARSPLPHGLPYWTFRRSPAVTRCMMGNQTHLGHAGPGAGAGLTRAQHNHVSKSSEQGPPQIWTRTRQTGFQQPTDGARTEVHGASVVWLRANKPKGTRATWGPNPLPRVCLWSSWSFLHEPDVSSSAQTINDGQREQSEESGWVRALGSTEGRAVQPTRHRQPGLSAPLTTTNWAAAAICGS